MKLTRKEYASPEEKRKDFWRGFIGWFVLNGILCLIQFAAYGVLYGLLTESSSSAYPILSTIAGLLPLLINIGLIIFFAFTRSQIALGMLAGFGAALALVIILGLIFTVACFVMMGSGSNTF